MKIARFQINNNSIIAVDGGYGFFDYNAILDARGFRSDCPGIDHEKQLIYMMNRGLLNDDFMREAVELDRVNGGRFRIAIDNAKVLLTHRPNKIICIARNWIEHAKEGGHDMPKEPTFFAKTDNTAAGHGEEIPIPGDVGRIDHEGELAIVISKTACNVKSENYLDYILGYTVINDITAREWQKKLGAQGLPWYAAKSMDYFSPFGPWIVTQSEVDPLDGKRVKLYVNGALRQDGTFDDMNWKLPALMEAVTKRVTLEAGDLIATGTPPGIGAIVPGDVVVVEIDGVGRLENRIMRKTI